MDVVRDGVDFLVFGGEKWLCSSGRAAVLYLKPEHIERYEPSYRFYWRVYPGFKWTDAPWDKPIHDNIESWSGELVKTAERFDPGCVAEDALCGFHASLQYFNKLGVNEIEDRVLDFSEHLINGLQALDIKVNTPIEAERRAGIVTYTLNSYAENVNTYESLKKTGFNVAHRYTGGVGGIRVSPHFFNTFDELDAFLEAQKKLLS